MSPIPDSPWEVSILCFLHVAPWRIPVWRTHWFISEDCAAAIASQLREGVPCWTVVVGEDSGGAITAACISITSSLTSTAMVLLFSSSSLFKISCTSVSVISGWEGMFSSTASAMLSSLSSSSSSSSSERFVAPEQRNN